MKIYKNFLSKEDFKKIESTIMGDYMPWYYNEFVIRSNKDSFQFTYSFMAEGEQTCHQDMIDLLQPILSKLKYKKLNRIKANLLSRDSKINEHGFHIDNAQEKGTTGIFYMNDCNGYTKFEDGSIVLSESNKYVEFNSKLRHTGSSCTDAKRRVVINFNYE